MTLEQQHMVQSTAELARQTCLKEIHHDTDEFSACVDHLIEQHKNSPAHRLGAAYLGLVGCMSAARMATLHADSCSRTYLTITDRLLKQLKAKDVELCPSVPGDCATRVAQIKVLRSSR